MGDYILPSTPRAASFQATFLLVLGAVLTGVSMPETFIEVDVYRHCAIWLGLSLGVSLLVQARGNLRRLIRADVVVMCSLYFLTFAEFLNPRVRVLYSLVTDEAVNSSWLVILTMVSIALGRHVALPFGRKPFNLPSLSLQGMFGVALVCFFLGYLWPLITVNFNPVSLVTEALGPRFTQPWQRERVGGWSSFLTELSLLHYAFAALMGVILSERRQLPLLGKLGLVALALFMMFMDFAGGTRYILMVKLGLMVSGYVAGTRKIHTVKIWLVAGLGLVMMWAITGEMLRLREQGISGYISGGDQQVVEQENYFMVDNNMITIARTLAVFPDTYPYPGSKVLMTALTKWIPRALWPDKPEDWGTSLEEAFGLDGSYTLAVTLTGEAYLISGWLSVALIGLLIGVICAMWNRLGERLRTNLDLFVYISGFFAAALCMRSLQFVTVAMLPTILILLFGKMLASQTHKSTQRLKTPLRLR
ncbi:MAG: O-antigen polymerase [Alteraurantiacibacter sp.]